MSDSFDFILHSPLTKEDWNKLTDAEHENTKYVTFQTPKGRQVKYIKCEVLDKIRAEIADLDDADYDYEGYYKAVTDAVKVIDKYKAERSDNT